MQRTWSSWFIAVLVALLAVAACLGWLAVGESGHGGNALPISLEGSDVLCLVAPQDTSIRSRLTADIDQAKQSVLVECYLISDPSIVQALKDAKTRGCAVRVIMEESPYGGFSMNSKIRNDLRRAGIDAVWGNRVYSFTHAKFVVVDAHTAWVMTANLTKSAFEKNREVFIRTEDPSVVAGLLQVFQADRKRSPCQPSTLIVSPAGGRAAIEAALREAQHTVDVATEVFDDGEIRTLLERAARRGVRVRILTAAPEKIAANSNTRSLLQGTGVTLRYLETPYLHAKYFIVDGHLAYAGSHNFSPGSLDENREVGILTRNPHVLAQLLDTFAADWEIGQ